MSTYERERATDGDEPSLEQSIREFARKDSTPIRREVVTNSLVQRVAGNSLQEIDDMVGELQKLRVFLVTEGERLQRELANYDELSRATQRSAAIIGESLPNWKAIADRASSH
jgi:hypothetical protein